MIDRVERLDALRLSEADQRHILHELDEAAVHPNREDLRATRRYRYVVREGLILQVDGAPVHFVVRPRNISAGGIAVLHGSFLYPGTACGIALRGLDGRTLLVNGRILHCRCVHGRAHEVNIRFVQPIEIEKFVDARQARLVTTRDPVSAQGPADYSSAQIAQLARQIEELARDRVPRDRLHRLVMQLAALVPPE